MIAPKGSGKSDLLKDMLAKGNPNHFVFLEEKIFESQLIARPKEYYHNKIVVSHDLIPTFEGMKTVQRQQFTNFWVSLLEGNYARVDHKLENVRTMVLFGIALDKLNEFKQALMSSTFFERVPPFRFDISDEQLRLILRFRTKMNIFGGSKSEHNIPVIKLPLPDKIDDEKLADIKYLCNKEIDERIEDLAMEQHLYDIQSAIRAQDYIKIFMMSNALLNGRKKVTKSDLMLYELVHPLFINAGRNLGTEKYLISLFKDNSGKDDKELIAISGLSRGTFYKYKKILKRKGLLQA